MNDMPILTALFSLEYAIVASLAAYYFFTKVKKLRAALIKAREENNDSPVTFAQLIEQQIQRTRKRIAGHERANNDPEHKKNAQILNKRVEFLELEKDVADDKIEDQSYWQIICERINKISPTQETKPETEEEPEASKKTVTTTDQQGEDDKKHKASIQRYQEQLAKVHQEFQDFRKTARKVVNLSSDYQGDDPDAALAELMADFQEHDKRLHARLKQLENENKKLAGSHGRDVTAANTEQQPANTAASDQDDTAAPTASEEEITRLRDIIDRQYGSLDELRKAMMEGGDNDESTQAVESHLDEVARAQKELQDCLQVLESENDRLLEELQQAQSHEPAPPATNNTELEELYDLRLKAKAYEEQVKGLSDELQAKDEALQKMSEEFDSLQDEFMRMYEKQNG
jgi:hypothetical protein